MMNNVYTRVEFDSWWGIRSNHYHLVVPKTVHYLTALVVFEKWITDNFTGVGDIKYKKCTNYYGQGDDSHLYLANSNTKGNIWFAKISADLFDITLTEDMDRDNYQEVAWDYTC